MAQFTWNDAHPGEPVPFRPADILDRHGQVIEPPMTYNGFPVVGGVWVDTDTGCIRYTYKDFQTAAEIGEMPWFEVFYDDPLTVVQRPVPGVRYDPPDPVAPDAVVQT